MYVYIHVHAHICIYTYTHTHMYTYMYIYIVNMIYPLVVDTDGRSWCLIHILHVAILLATVVDQIVDTSTINPMASPAPNQLTYLGGRALICRDAIGCELIDIDSTSNCPWIVYMIWFTYTHAISCIHTCEHTKQTHIHTHTPACAYSNIHVYINICLYDPLCIYTGVRGSKYW